MNNERRERIEAVITNLEEIMDELSLIQEEEQAAYDNLPEGLQESQRGMDIEECAEQLQESVDELDTMIDNLRSEVLDVY